MIQDFVPARIFIPCCKKFTHKTWQIILLACGPVDMVLTVFDFHMVTQNFRIKPRTKLLWGQFHGYVGDSLIHTVLITFWYFLNFIVFVNKVLKFSWYFICVRLSVSPFVCPHLKPCETLDRYILLTSEVIFTTIYNILGHSQCPMQIGLLLHMYTSKNFYC
jgi:hypothetical protein